MGQNPAVTLFLALGIMIVAARLGGSLSRRLGQARVLGELIVGVILGPTLFDMLHNGVLGLYQAHLESTIHELAELGVLLLMFNVGLEVHFKELAKVGRVALSAGVVGALLPVAVTLPVMLVFGYPLNASLFAGVTLAATSVSISAQVLLELGVLNTKEGNALLATALIDDVVAILLVSLTVALLAPNSGSQTADMGALVLIVVQMVAYLSIAFAVAWFALPLFIGWIHNHPELSQSYGVPAVAIVAMLLFGWSAEMLGGVAAITGAFIAGVGLSRARESAKRQIETTVRSLAYAFLVPVFFVSVGLEIDLHNFSLAAIPLAGTLLAVAIFSKTWGCSWGARRGGFSPLEAHRLGVCMISRGEVGLIVASVGLSGGVFQADEPLFASLFLVILLTTLITPPLVRRVFTDHIKPAPALEKEG